MREPYFTYEHKNTAELFMEMRKSSISLAIVLDEYGATAGLITLEDLLEEIVGEIRDEYDTDEEDPIVKLSDREYLVLGSTNLEDLCEKLDLDFESDDYDTIGGYLIGFIPMAIIAGLVIDRYINKRIVCLLGMIAGTAVCYLFGTAWLAYQANMGFQAALMAGVIPFIVGDLIKMVLAMLIGPQIRSQLKRANLY